MYNHSRFLVYHYHIIVLIDNIYRNIFGYKLYLPGRQGQYNLDCISWFYPVAGFHSIVVDKNITGIGSVLYPGTGCVFDPAAEKFVNPQERLSRINGKPVMFEKFLLVGQIIFSHGYSYLFLTSLI
jgi:hypothetical protein